MKLDWSSLPKPIICLSPMADMTDSAFCQVVREVTAAKGQNNDQLIVFREMVSAEAVVRGSEKTLGMTDIHPAERPLVQQIFGSDPAVMAAAAEKSPQSIIRRALISTWAAPCIKSFITSTAAHSCKIQNLLQIS